MQVLLRMVILATAALGLLVWKWDFINQVYFRNQLTSTGLIINGTIIGLFLLGLLRMVISFVAYAGEERALRLFVSNFEASPEDLVAGVPTNSIIHRRHATVQSMHQAKFPINQAALASTLLASESTRSSLPKFIHNILILSGVFGTIVSLSIALIGASDLLESSVNVGGMGMVVHGMSTALSTTITAIVCFLYFGYFYIKLHDVQTNLLSAVEQVTTTLLMPRYHVQADSALYEFTGLVRSLQQLVNKMQTTQSTFQAMEGHIFATLDTFQSEMRLVSQDLGDIRRSLRTGFRLPEDQ